MFYTNFNELCVAMSECRLEDSTPISKCLKRYFNAQHAAPKFGLVGVGCISFAENRLIEFQRRAYKFKHRRGDQVVVRQLGEGTYQAMVTGYSIDNGNLVYDLVSAAGEKRWAYKDQIDA